MWETILWFLVIGAIFYWLMRMGGCGAHGHGGHGGHSGHGGHDRPDAPDESQDTEGTRDGAHHHGHQTTYSITSDT